MSEKSLFPAFEVPELVSLSDPAEDKYKWSVAWDIEKGDFVQDGANRLVKCDGKDTYIQWCYKIARTERFSYLGYPDWIGTEMDDAAQQPSHAAVESCIERTVTEALMVNPRTEYVRGFTFSWNGDSVRCECTVKGMDWEEFKLIVTAKEVSEV